MESDNIYLEIAITFFILGFIIIGACISSFYFWIFLGTSFIISSIILFLEYRNLKNRIKNIEENVTMRILSNEDFFEKLSKK